MGRPQLLTSDGGTESEEYGTYHQRLLRAIDMRTLGSLNPGDMKHIKMHLHPQLNIIYVCVGVTLLLPV